MLRAYKYRLMPTLEQYQKMMVQFDATRFIYNWALGKKIEHYKEHGEDEDKKKRSLSDFTLIKMLPELKGEKDFLENAAAQPLQQTIINLGRAYGAFFKKQNRFPRFKSYKDSSNYRFQYPQGVKVNFKDKTIFLPKIGDVVCVYHRRFEGKVKTCTVSKSASDKIYISVLVDDGKVVPLAEEVVEGRAVGVHMDIRNLVTSSDGQIIKNPRFLDKKITRIKKKNAQLSRLRKKFEKENPDSKGQSKKMAFALYQSLSINIHKYPLIHP